eukprot:676004-Pelagomonas_calceolata.AAC.3
MDIRGMQSTVFTEAACTCKVTLSPLLPSMQTHFEPIPPKRATHASHGCEEGIQGAGAGQSRVVKGAYKGQEQDIEGVISHGKVWVVQSRPQVIS